MTCNQKRLVFKGAIIVWLQCRGGWSRNPNDTRKEIRGLYIFSREEMRLLFNHLSHRAVSFRGRLLFKKIWYITEMLPFKVLPYQQRQYTRGDPQLLPRLDRNKVHHHHQSIIIISPSSSSVHHHHQSFIIISPSSSFR